LAIPAWLVLGTATQLEQLILSQKQQKLILVLFVRAAQMVPIAVAIT